MEHVELFVVFDVNHGGPSQCIGIAEEFTTGHVQTQEKNCKQSNDLNYLSDLLFLRGHQNSVGYEPRSPSPSTLPPRLGNANVMEKPL
jgi:hypothetical protein